MTAIGWFLLVYAVAAIPAAIGLGLVLKHSTAADDEDDE